MILADSIAGVVAGLRASDWWTIATAGACSASAGVIGCFLVLRRQSLLGDAISHAVLPGLAGAFLLSGTREPWAMMLGALVAGLATALLSAWVSRAGRLPEDTSMGVVFTVLFALGVVMLNQVEGIDLDPSCVLYGALETTALSTSDVLGVEVPRAFLMLAPMLVLNVLVVVVFFKELKIASFDPALATSLGIGAGLVHYALMGLTAATAVASFEAVGSILVVAMLVAPGATAHLLTNRLWVMVVLAGVLGVLASFVGYVLALAWSASVAGMIGAVAGAMFAAALVAAPREGLVSRLASRATLRARIHAEDALGALYRWAEARPHGPAPTELGAALGWRWAARWRTWDLRRRGLVSRDDRGRLNLTDRGRARAVQVVRSHRLWESFLAERLGLAADHVHEPSHRVEHFISRGLSERLESELSPRIDPHGRPIPPADATGGST